MRPGYLLSALAACIPLHALAQGSCTPGALPAAAGRVAAIRHQLHTVELPAGDAHIPPTVAQQLLALQSALTAAGDAALACAAHDVTPESLQGTLATALRANLPGEAESTNTPGAKDSGAFGADLAVQIFQLFGSPRWFEVSFRYGMACGDSNLLLVYDGGSAAPQPWQRRLRWGAAGFRTADDAMGDFVLLTPLTGNVKAPVWRFLVAHGHPSCADSPRPSRFDLDLLAPTADPDRPHVDWHFQHQYTQGTEAPRLATTENTIEFRLTPATLYGKAAAGPASETATTFRFTLAADGTVLPATDVAGDPTTRSRP